MVSNSDSLATLAWAGFAVHSEALARLAVVGFRAGAVEVVLHAVARGLVLAGVRLAGVRGRPAGDLRRERGIRRVAIMMLQLEQLRVVNHIIVFLLPSTFLYVCYWDQL